MRTPIYLLLLLASACASAGGGPPSAAPVETRRSTVTYSRPDGAPVEVTTDNSVETRSFRVTNTPAELWHAVALAYADLGIPLAAYDTAQMYIGNPGLAVSNGRLGNQRISRYLNCGADPFGSSLADHYNVRLNVVSRVMPDPNGAVLQTQVLGDAAQRGVSSISVACASTGQLEEALAAATRLRLAGLHPSH